MEQAYDLAVEYAKDRVQFDRPIATFQVIKHKAADMLAAHRAVPGRHALRGVGVRRRRSGAGRGRGHGQGVRGRGGQRRRAASRIQIHGGVGFTWDCDAHLHYRRAKQDDLLLGYHGAWHRKVADRYLATA